MIQWTMAHGAKARSTSPPAADRRIPGAQRAVRRRHRAWRWAIRAEQVLDGLAILKGVHGRLELVGQTAGKAPVFVDYAHTPDGLDVLLRAARPHVRGKHDRGVRLRRRSRRRPSGR